LIFRIVTDIIEWRGIVVPVPGRKNTALIREEPSGEWLLFTNPVETIEATRFEEVVPMLLRVERAVTEHGRYAAGFIGYEAAPAFDTALTVRPPDSFPLLWFGVYTRPESFRFPRPPEHHGAERLTWTPSVSRAEYRRAVARIREFIAAGDTYQVNYTFRLHTPFESDPWDFFQGLFHAQKAGYAAYIDTGRFVVCSSSPELFFRLDGREVISRPMKGTAPRGLTLPEDERRKRWLRRSEKNRAENIMIVDMVRNDLGKVAATGSVHVPGLFDIERFPTLWQMTSTVRAETDASLTEILGALFPCASITGAPKPRTMQIIADLETTPRRVYTGTVGFIRPGRAAQFNVAIRTVLIDRSAGRAEYGVGGGILWDSTSEDEYSECRTKARILTERIPGFSLLETILWTPGEGFFLLDYHLRRLHESAVYFGFRADIGRIREELSSVAALLPGRSHKVRLLVSEDGGITCETSLLDGLEESGPVTVGLSPKPVDSSCRFLYHKTTNRGIYDTLRSLRPECGDVLLWNERGEITETTVANIVVELDGELLTPPVRSGLLPGTFRAWLLDTGAVREKTIRLEDLGRIDRIFLVNSVRKRREARLVT